MSLKQTARKKSPRVVERTTSSKLDEDASVASFGSRHETDAGNNEQYLFLLEFFIHHVASDRLAKLNQMFFVPTTISVEFLNFRGKDGIEITPVDPLFEPQAGVADEVEYFYSGRSAMFAIDQYTVVNKIYDLIVALRVEKKMPEGVKPDVLVGRGELDLSKHFAALRKEMLQCWHKLAPPPRVFQGEVPLSCNEQVVGTVSMYARISAFGQTIVTEFDAPPDRSISTYLFKGDNASEKSVTYKCRIVDSKTEDVCREDMEELASGGPACRVCVKERHPCTPCGRASGATLKPNAKLQPEEYRGSPVAPQLPGTRERSRPNTCADVHEEQASLIQSSRGLAQPCGKAVVLKVSGILDTGQGHGKKPTVTVAPESQATGPDCTDPDHDVFVLRIGKKGIVGAGEKSDIQLEMRTPKGAERGPPIRCETREMQTDDKNAKGQKQKKQKKKK